MIKIAISGTHGVGKTTLVNRLTKTLSKRFDPNKDGTKWFTSLVGTECNVINRPKKSEYKTYQNTEQPEPNPCLSEGEDCPF